VTNHRPPEYHRHDDLYRKLRDCGANGWNNEGDDAYAEMFALIETDLPFSATDGPVEVLEIGCGAGNFSILLAQKGYTVTGVDISPVAVAWAVERASSIQGVAFCVDNVLNLSTCGDASYDSVVDGHCLHCIIGEDRAKCLASVFRVLRQGGSFVVLTMCGEVTNQQMLGVFDPDLKVTLHDGRPTRYIGGVDSIISEIVSAGFIAENVRIVPRKDVNDMDNLIVRCRKPSSNK